MAIEVTKDRAFLVLRKASQNQNRKLAMSPTTSSLPAPPTTTRPA